MSVESAAISVLDLAFDYHDHPALCGVSFTVAPGERVGLVGPNGAGKSTLLLHLNGLLRGRGSVEINGVVLHNKTLGQVRSRVGIVFSDPEDQLFMPTLREDAAFGPLNMGLSRPQAEERADRALETMGLSGKEERSGHHLSDGERRRAAIATVLSMQPQVWVLDEPAANLDPRGRRELIGVLKNLVGTVVLASHDLDLVVQVCKRCLLLDGGALVADGECRQLLADRELMEKHGLEVPWRLRERVVE